MQNFRFQMTSVICFSELYSNDCLEVQFENKFYFHSSCHYLDEFNVIQEHLQRKDEVYEMIMRRVKMITNFARFG